MSNKDNHGIYGAYVLLCESNRYQTVKIPTTIDKVSVGDMFYAILPGSTDKLWVRVEVDAVSVNTGVITVHRIDQYGTPVTYNQGHEELKVSDIAPGSVYHSMVPDPDYFTAGLQQGIRNYKGPGIEALANSVPAATSAIAAIPGRLKAWAGRQGERPTSSPLAPPV